MDFQKLMQTAAANQQVVQKRFDHKKQRKEDEEKLQRAVKLLKEKKAAKKLKEMKTESERRQLEYKGLLVRTKEGTHVIRPSNPVAEPSTSAHNKETKRTDKESRRDDVRAPCDHSIGSKLPVHSKKTQKERRKDDVEAMDDHSIGSKLPVNNKKGIKQQDTHADLSKACSSRNCKSRQAAKTKPAAVINFQDLLKVAQMKSSEVVEKEKSKLQVKDPLIGRGGGRELKPPSSGGMKSTQGSSPVGKSLLERGNSRLKRTHSMMERGDTRASALITSSKSEAPSTSRAGGRKPSDGVREGGSMEGGGTGAPWRTNGQVKGSGRVVGDRDKMVAGLQHRAQPPSGALAKTVKATPMTAQLQRQKLKPNTAKPNSFYGAASARLLQDGRSVFATRRGPLKYTSTWVDEMSDFIQRGVCPEDYYSDDEDEDMDDFVVSGDEEEESVSSAIRAIFGYDRRKYAGERDDDVVMESSFAQQQFEEQRSAQIGQLEDIEDIKKEQAKLSRKKRKIQSKPGGKTSFSQSKLKFQSSR